MVSIDWRELYASNRAVIERARGAPGELSTGGGAAGGVDDRGLVTALGYLCTLWLMPAGAQAFADAYLAEIIRGGILSVPFGQIEAARAPSAASPMFFAIHALVGRGQKSLGVLPVGRIIGHAHAEPQARRAHGVVARFRHRIDQLFHLGGD